MVTLELRDSGKELYMRAHYEYRQRLASIDGAYFSHEYKSWIAPIESLPQIESRFAGEIYYKTPRWILLGEKEPPETKYLLYSEPATEPELKYNMFDYQKLGFKYMVDRIEEFGFVLNADSVGLGKCHGKGTKIMLANGEIRNVEEIQSGDHLMGDDGTPRLVTSLASGKEMIYEVTLDNGDSFTCNESHILSMMIVSENGFQGYENGSVIDIPIKEYLSLSEEDRGLLKAYKMPVESFGDEEPVLCDPYEYGTWAGDYINYDMNYTPSDPEFEVFFMSTMGGIHILPCYKCGSEETRLNLLAGIIDTHGAISGKTCGIVISNVLLEDVLFVCRSLGFNVTKDIDDGDTSIINLTGDLTRIPTRKEWPLPAENDEESTKLVYDIVVKELQEDFYYGFTIDGNHRYLLGDFTVTHNTIQSIAVMKWYMENRNIKKILIICKKSIKTQWESEIRKFTDLDVPIFVTKDAKPKRMKAYEGMYNCDSGILITNYHNFLNDTDIVNSLGCDFCIIDEVHTLKARQGVMHNNIARTVKGKPTILLTGTPIMSRPDDIYGIVNIVSDAFFGNYKNFCERYIVAMYGIYGYQIIGARHLDELQEKIQAIMIRRTNYDVDLDLPEQLPPIEMYADLDKVQQKMLDYVSALKDELDDRKKELLNNYSDSATKKGMVPAAIKEIIFDINERSKMYIATMQFIADDPMCFVEMGPDRGINNDLLPMVPKNYTMSAKTEIALDKIEDIVDGDEKVVVFCHFATATKLLKRHLDKRFGKNGPEVVLYTGAQNDEQRDRNVKAFREDDNCKVFIATEAAAEGLNLQVTRHMIHFEQADTYAQRNQRIGRIRRIGSQFDHVCIYDILSRDSFDEGKIKKLQRDKELSESLLDA